MRNAVSIVVRAVLFASAAPVGMVAAMQAAAQTRAVNQPTLPMAEALQRIAAATGQPVDYDPDAVRGLNARPVRNAAGAEAAVRQAVRNLPLTMVLENGRVQVSNDILIRARRDEAETSLLARQATTSTRTGESLRDQPRNSQVITDRLIREQQSLTIGDALRNAGGVTVDNAAIQSGVTYSVRGFGSAGAVNGLPGSTGVAAGTTQPVANIERIEVLKGPDAILIGSNNLGGLINIVTKKPSADPLLSLEAQTGSFGLRRFVLDANNSLIDDGKLSARVIASASGADRNWGGYRGDKDFLFAPSLRFKDSKTDIILNATVGEQGFGSTPVAVFNPETNSFFDVPRDRPLLRQAEQGAQINTSQFFGEATHRPTSWLTLVARGQHQRLSFEQSQLAPRGLAQFISPTTLFISGARNRQVGTTNALDGYARFDVRTGAFQHKLTVGYTYAKSATDYFYSPSDLTNPFVDFVAITAPPGTLPARATELTLQQDISQKGLYGQYLLRFHALALLAGVRHNQAATKTNNILFRDVSEENVGSTVPNFGAVLDISDDVSLFATLAYGYFPTTTLDRAGNRLPDTRSRNIEAGVKIDLFDDRALINVSWFDLRQTNIIVLDPTDPTFRFSIAVPGQSARGVDLNISGELLPGLSVNGSFTRTVSRPLTPNEFLRVTVAQPRDQYSLYLSYRRPVGSVRLGTAAGLYGRSSAAANALGTIFAPPARQFDLNWFLDYGALSLNLNVRNVFDRVNYGTTYVSTLFPISEPRNWRLSATYRFK